MESIDFTLVIVSLIALAIFVLLFHFALRWPWVWALVGSVALFLTMLLPWTAFGIAVRVLVSLAIAGLTVLRLRVHSGWRWTYALAVGVAVLCVLGILDLPIQTHAVKLDMPASQ